LEPPAVDHPSLPRSHGPPWECRQYTEFVAPMYSHGGRANPEKSEISLRGNPLMWERGPNPPHTPSYVAVNTASSRPMRNSLPPLMRARTSTRYVAPTTRLAGFNSFPNCIWERTCAEALLAPPPTTRPVRAQRRIAPEDGDLKTSLGARSWNNSDAGARFNPRCQRTRFPLGQTEFLAQARSQMQFGNEVINLPFRSMRVSSPCQCRLKKSTATPLTPTPAVRAIPNLIL